MKDLLRILGFLAAILAACFFLSPSRTPARRSLSGTGLPGNAPVQSNAAPDGLESGPASAGARSESTVRARKRTVDMIVARVNGAPIRWGEVQAGIGNNIFGAMREEASHDRRERLIAIETYAQYLKTQHVEVASAELDAIVADLQRNPPPSGGCPCCSFSSLDAYLAANFLTPADLRAEIRIDLGLKQRVAALWAAEYPVGEKRQGLLERERPRIERTYAKLSHIFFKTVQQPDYGDDPDGVRTRVKKKALDAWQKLQAGAGFAELARTCSEDTISQPKGGQMGCVLVGIFGTDVEKAIEALKPGTISQPVESPWGYHILRREALTDQDVLDILKSEETGRRLSSLYGSIVQGAKIERFE